MEKSPWKVVCTEGHGGNELPGCYVTSGDFLYYRGV